MEKNFVIKSVIAKAGTDGKVVGYNVNYHHKSYPDSVQSVFYNVEDMKNIFHRNNEVQVQELVGKSCYIDKKIIVD